jgi:hypothetical protein
VKYAFVQLKVSGSANPVAEAFAALTLNTKASGNGVHAIFLLSEAWVPVLEKVTEVSLAAEEESVWQHEKSSRKSTVTPKMQGRVTAIAGQQVQH